MHQTDPWGKFFTMASQAAAAQPSSGLQLQLQHLPPYSRTTRRINHLPPLRTQHQRDREQNQQIGTLRLLLTVPYFAEHHERTRIDRDDDHDENVDDDEEDYVFVERESEHDKMVQLTEVPDEHFEGNQPGPIEDEGDFTDTGKFGSFATLFIFFPFLSRISPRGRRVANRRRRTT